jgi:hypothetical protein
MLFLVGGIELRVKGVPPLGTVVERGDPFLLRAVSATKEVPAGLETMADDFTTAVFALRC